MQPGPLTCYLLLRACKAASRMSMWSRRVRRQPRDSCGSHMQSGQPGMCAQRSLSAPQLRRGAAGRVAARRVAWCVFLSRFCVTGRNLHPVRPSAI
jgi:hypothetical protein